jgi:serine/threonine protein kinase
VCAYKFGWLQVINASGHSSSVDWWELGIFLYELMYGFTPFRGSHREQTFENVLHRALVFPEDPVISPAAQDAVRALLIRDPSRRLGAVGGAEEVKGHQFFVGLDFSLIRWQTAPFVPSARDNIASVPPSEEFIFAMDC